MTRIIFHIDVNSAYLSWTAISLLKKGEPTDLRTIPSIIGGSIEDRHGIVLAKSTPAKKHGIVTGEPIIQAMQKCPNLIAYPPDFALYSKCSRAMFDILSEYSDRIEPFSIDEGFLDYTGMEALFGPPIEAAKAIQKRILAELGFTVNIGISTNKLLAKMAGGLYFRYFPSLKGVGISLASVFAWGAYFLLCFLPLIAEIWEVKKWNAIKSKI